MDQSQADREATIIKSSAQAAALTIVNEANAYVKTKTLNYQSMAYKNISDSLNMTVNDHLMDFMYYTNLLELKNSTILVGVDTALLKV